MQCGGGVAGREYSNHISYHPDDTDKKNHDKEHKAENSAAVDRSFQ